MTLPLESLNPLRTGRPRSNWPSWHLKWPLCTEWSGQRSVTAEEVEEQEVLEEVFEEVEDKDEDRRVVRQKDIQRTILDGRGPGTLTYRHSIPAGSTGTGVKVLTGVVSPIPAPGRITPRPRIRIEVLTSLTSL